MTLHEEAREAARLNLARREHATPYVPDYDVADLEADADLLFRLADENERLREFFEAHEAFERGIIDFDLHNEAVGRLERARAALASARPVREGDDT